MLKVKYINLSGKTVSVEISEKDQVKKLDQIRNKGFSILTINKISQ